MAKKIDINLETLLEAGAHFGHQTKRWNPKMAEYVYGVKDGVYIIDLIKTKKLIEEALEILTKAVKEKKLILFVGTKKQSKEKIKEIGLECGLPYVDERWLGGTLTNYEQVRNSVKTLENLKKDMSEGKYNSYTKMERLLLQRKIDKLEKTVGGLTRLDRMPDLMIVVDIRRERGAVFEAAKGNIKVIGFVDTNSDPTEVDNIIPINDDATAAVVYVLDLMKQTIMSAQKGLK